MADTKPAAEPQPQPEPVKKRSAPGAFNKRQQDSLDKAALIIAVARKPEYAPLLAAREISADTLNQLDSDIAACKERLGKTKELTSDVRAATEAEKQAQDALLAAVKEIQTAAKQKYARGETQRMKDYFVGERLAGKRATILQVVHSILEKLKSDTLPGITPAKLTNLRALRDAYVAANAAQSDAQSRSTSEREAIESAVQGINDRRVQIQLAADAEWPARNKANAAIRREFQLPADRSFTG